MLSFEAPEGGLTHVLDKGLGPRAWEDVLETSGLYIDVVKLGWGTAFVTANLRKKLDVLREKRVVVGGTFFEAVWATGQLERYKQWLGELGFDHVEISDGAVVTPLVQKIGHDPQVILAGRGTNDDMGRWIADSLHDRRGAKAGSALVLGVTFKENVPDLRNSRAFDVVKRLQWLGYSVDVSDPLADPEELRHEQGLELTALDGKRYDLVVGAVPHAAYRDLSDAELAGLLNPGGLLADIKGMWRERALDPSIGRWTL